MKNSLEFYGVVGTLPYQSTSLSLAWEIAHAYLQNPRKILMNFFFISKSLVKGEPSCKDRQKKKVTSFLKSHILVIFQASQPIFGISQ